MEQKHKEVLRRMRQKIVEDLDVYNGIIQPLMTEYVLKEEDANDIKKGVSKEERANILLDLLPERGCYAFEVFHQSLRHQYDWLSDDMDKLLAQYEPPQSRNNAMDVPIVYPNLPPVSPLTVTREEMVQKLKDALENLEPNGYIALHGMKGFGKSCLTASTLKDKNFTLRLFNNEIYWIKFGYKRNINEEILVQLNNLYHQIKNLGSIETVNSEPLEKSLKQIIDNHFRKKNHQMALLILDDVCHKEIVDEFDFACKTVVITPDLGVLNKRTHMVVKMNHGFTENETLGLFAKVLDINMDQLPKEAKLIHEECKGMPLLIAMFAAQFEYYKHEMRSHRGRWKYYLNCLQTKNAKNMIISEFMELQKATFEMCIGQLENEMKERYENLAIFSEDVNITPKTLEILWDEEPYSVEDQMLKFCHKSLAARKWNDELRCYIYGIHDLLLCHIRSKLTPEQLRDKHVAFIEKYRKYCNGDFSKLPNDNYSFSYIGHHLEQAEMYQEFHGLYTNFDFLQAKINYTGLSDLFIDLKKYRKYITKNGDPIIESNLIDLEHFLEDQANTLAKHRSMKCLDLVQIALDHSDKSFIRNTAEKIASSRSYSLYLSRSINSKTKKYLNFCEEVIKNTSTVAFTNEPNHILVGTYDGEIILWDCENRKPKFFSGHKAAIKKIILSIINGDYFLALSTDGSLKLFALSENEYTSNGVSISTQSPRHKQTSWTRFFESPHDDSKKTLVVYGEIITDMKFAQTSNKIAACTDHGTIMLWDANGNIEWQDKLKSHCFGGISFTSEDNLLHVMDESTSAVRIYQKSENGYTYVSQFNLQLNNPKVIYFSRHPEEHNCLVIVTNKNSLYFKWFYKNRHIHSFEKFVKTEEENEDVSYVCATLTYDARYLIIANSKGKINVMKAFCPDDLITCFKGNVTSLDPYWMYFEDFHMICGSDKKMIYRWKIRSDEKPKSVKKLLFDAKMNTIGEENMVVLKTSPITITTSNGKKIESVHGKIISMKLNEDSSKLIYLTESGSVTTTVCVVLYDMTTEQSSLIAKLDSLNDFIDVIQMKGDYMVLCKANNNLQVWLNTKISKKIDGSDFVLSVHQIANNCIFTVSKHGKMKYWNIEDFPWSVMYEFIDDEETIVSSHLSSNKNLLALLKNGTTIMVYNLPNVEIDQLDSFKIETYFKKEFKQGVTLCEFSNDEKFLAVALQNGDISIIDVPTQVELGKLDLHCSPICQLHWSPVCINSAILLTVSGDELAWWNVNYLRGPNRSQNRRSRMGFDRSQIQQGISPRSSYQAKPQESIKLQITPPVTLNLEEFWSRKLGVDVDRPALLGCVCLPGTCTDNVRICVAPDFSQFLTVDIHGTISNYTIFSVSDT
ncbi:hypothetical protein TKK_0008740 [Trichogramma kaykai]|uniref:CARD domain-containing protein n=1 Tax=Trichogramma kaykai TaxID=54128 RepID=A0ABD2X3J6_9HYME